MRAHIALMVAKSEPSPPPSKTAAKRGRWYRGVKLQRPTGTPSIPEETLRAAVREAFAEHARKRAGDK